MEPTMSWWVWCLLDLWQIVNGLESLKAMPESVREWIGSRKMEMIMSKCAVIEFVVLTSFM